MSTAAQVKAIQTLRRRIGMEEPEYRAFLAARAGQSSSKMLSVVAANTIIGELQQLAGAGAPRPASERATGRFAPVLQALWLSAYDLGLVADPTDRAMMAFVRRQTGADHTRFLIDPAHARPAIEGLKAWIARDGGVEWPAVAEPLPRRWAVCRAIAERLREAGALAGPAERPAWPDAAVAEFRPADLPEDITDWTAADFLRLSNLMGAALRERLAAKGAAA